MKRHTRLAGAIVSALTLAACGGEGFEESEELSEPTVEPQQKTPVYPCYYQHYSWCNAHELIGGVWVCTETCRTKVSVDCGGDYGTIECTAVNN